MPSRPIPPLPRAPPPQPPPLITTSSSPLAPAAAASWPPHRYKPISSHIVLPSVGAAFSFLLVFTFCFRKISRKRTVSSDSKPPHRFSYSSLRRATNSFSPSLRLGQGGFGSVFRGTLPNGQPLAVKVMDFGSLQGEREFQNELIFASNLDSPYIITALGFSSERKRRRTMLLIYELMPNGNLQDALLRRKAPELADWRKRFSVAVDIARGIEYLHSLDPPVIHGDIKPSNILLDECFSAKISDFGLAWFKTGNNNQNHEDVKVDSEQKNVDLESNSGAPVDDYGSVVEDTESVTTGFEEFNLGVDQSPEGLLRAPVSLTSPETVEAVSASPDTTGVALSPEGISDGANALSGIELVNEGTSGGKGIKNQSGKDWWWKQDKSGGLENGAVKDYVMEWIGTEIKKERPKSDWIGTSSSSTSQPTGKIDKKKNGKRLDWWVSLEEDRDEKILKKAKRRPPREWWKEEYCEELEKKRKRKKKKKEKKHEMVTNTDYNNGGENLWWPRDEELYVERKKKRRNNSSKSSIGSLDWFSGELLRGLHNSHDSLSGKTQKSGGISSTPSMRGTVCYVAPEYGGGGNLSEKSDVYSFGVLLLVLVAGRRPLEVTNSPMSEFQRANLMHWARNLACAGKLLDLVDQSIQFLDQDQAQLCMTVALLCLQKAPARRPWMKEVVGMLTGELQAPQLPIEFSPSPPSRFPFKSRSVEKVR